MAIFIFTDDYDSVGCMESEKMNWLPPRARNNSCHCLCTRFSGSFPFHQVMTIQTLPTSRQASVQVYFNKYEKRERKKDACKGERLPPSSHGQFQSLELKVGVVDYQPRYIPAYLYWIIPSFYCTNFSTSWCVYLCFLFVDYC